MGKIEELVEKLRDGSEAVLDLTDKNGNTHRLNALYAQGDTPRFELFFPPNAWKSSDLALGVNCQVMVRHKGVGVNLVAELDQILNKRRLQFIAREPIKPEALREYFRVLINTTVEIGYIPGPKEVKTKKWQMVGTTVDLSASGVLGLFAEKPPSNNRLQIRIIDPSTLTPIACIGHVVRTYRMRKKRYQVALHFDNVEQSLRDKLIACCLAEQRKQLRENVEAG
ncbi:MAG: hypothetical protein CSA31_00180 [Desulfobulbus propionicus]|nr:MAG: hypothetical protein CSB34_04325 [Desulfobulbus propionicus]PIE60802.1 MAG: hypothetical protein CSA31_00180 [Desulfobulbus propionicus]